MTGILPVLSAMILAVSGQFAGAEVGATAGTASVATGPTGGPNIPAIVVLPESAQASTESVAHADAAEDEKNYERLRNLAIDGDHASAQRGLLELLRHEDLPDGLRMRIYVTAISIATNHEDWPQAFTLLNQAMAHAPDVPEEAAGLLGVASQLYATVGEVERAIDLGLRALQAAEDSGDDKQACRALAALAIAYESGNVVGESLERRERQVQTCTRAGDVLFAANGKYGVGKALIAQGRHREALKMGEESLADYLSNGYEAGANNARLLIAQSLIGLDEGPRRAEALLAGLIARYRGRPASLNLFEVEWAYADLLESRGDAAGSLAHLKEAMKHAREADRNARARQLAYLQLEFDTRHKEHQISLLETEKALAEANATASHRRLLLLATGAGGLIVSSALLLLLLHRTVRDRRRYRWEAEHDGLTRLVNQQHLLKLGEVAFSEAVRTGQAFTAVAVDIDLFKQINDSHGHAAGDAVLRALGGWILDAAGDKRGIAARRGGDEFMVLLPGDAAQGKEMVQSLRDHIVPVSVHNRALAFTISAGICQADARTRSLEQLMHQADKALYRAKRQGRDRVVCACEPIAAEESAAAQGSLVVVGSGIQFGRHASERTLSEIQQAQVVFCLADPFALAMITRLRPDTINLGAYYATGQDRRVTYRQIDAAIMGEVRAGKAVCAVFYGHPGVFADVPHQVIRKVRAEGMIARMEPGISAEACLYADLGIDPGQRGVQSLEATHFLAYDRQLDTQGTVLLWQVALAGDWSCTRLDADPDGLRTLVEKLLRWYPPDHEVILYEAAQLPIDSFRAEHLRLRDLPDARYQEFTTLVISPLATELKRDPAFERADA